VAQLVTAPLVRRRRGQVAASETKVAVGPRRGRKARPVRLSSEPMPPLSSSLVRVHRMCGRSRLPAPAGCPADRVEKLADYARAKSPTTGSLIPSGAASRCSSLVATGATGRADCPLAGDSAYRMSRTVARPGCALAGGRRGRECGAGRRPPPPKGCPSQQPRQLIVAAQNGQPEPALDTTPLGEPGWAPLTPPCGKSTRAFSGSHSMLRGLLLLALFDRGAARRGLSLDAFCGQGRPPCAEHRGAQVLFPVRAGADANH